jgi:hypothetical protein
VTSDEEAVGYRRLLLHAGKAAVVPDWDGRLGGTSGTRVGKHGTRRRVHIAEEWPADAVRLDAYDANAGAGRFYARCGFTERGRVVYKGDPLVYFERLLR